MIRSAWLAVSLALGMVGVAAAASLTPSTILANPSSYDGKAVTVAGKVAHFQTNKTLMGTVAAYQLCDAKCVIVIDQKNTTHADGDSVTVSGTFNITFKGPKKTYSNVVMIK